MSLILKTTEEIHTERLILRRFKYEDNFSMRKNWVSDPLVQHMYLEPVYENEEDVRQLLSKYISAYEEPHKYRWSISLKNNDESIGMIAYFLIDEKNHSGEIEYCIGQSFQNNGYMTEAVAAVLEFGFNSVNLHRVQICHRGDNPKSKRVIEKSGFKYEGTLRDFIFADNKYVDRLYYSILKSEWSK